MDSWRDDEFPRDPNDETRLRIQNDKETLGAVALNQPPPWKIGDRLGDFVLERLLGSGSSGFVYQAIDVKTDRRCALKLLRQDAPDDLLRNKLGFRRMMSLDHPNLVRVNRIHQFDTYIGLSMEEVEGQTFKNAAIELRELPSQQAYPRLLSLLRDFAAGLAAMHTNGYIHRDIKPDNLMVDQSGRGRVIDYGLVDVYELNQQTYSVRGFLLGTPHYFAPEVIWSQRYLPAGDIFSLGIVILDALRALERSESWRLQRSETSQSDDAQSIGQAIDELGETVPEVISETCREMLDREPSERPTAMALARLGLPPSHQMPWIDEEPLVGRQREQHHLQRWVDEVFAGQVSRLHLTGESGVGKTRLLEEAVRYIGSKSWGQVFYARCRLREDQPLQAFDQICDAITNRYMKGDREPLELDPVSVETLQSIFPVLKNVLVSNLRLAPADARTKRLDALEAAVRLSVQLRGVGPLFIIVDDSQWADRDSRNVLDAIQSAKSGEGLGIITASRKQEDPHRVPATEKIHLKPLSSEAGCEILAIAANRWSVEVTETMLHRLAKSTGGSPFRLRELADEFRPGGALHDVEPITDSAIEELAQIDRLWQQRAGRLSRDARRVLLYVVTAEGAVSTQQLGTLTGLEDSVDVAVSELSRQRLVIDEATGGECISIFHDQVADGLISTLGEKEIRRAHSAWAKLLVQNSGRMQPARIANHFFSAGQPGRAVSYAILAAEDADKVMAKSEAGRWYGRVIDHVSGTEKVAQLKNAARCYHEADHPHQAALYYQRLADTVDGDDRTHYLMLSTAMSIRSGRFSEMRDQLSDLSTLLGLPSPRSSLLGRIAFLVSVMRLFLRKRKTLLSRVAGDVERYQRESNCPDSAKATADPVITTRPSPFERSSADPKERLRQRQLRHCLALARPVSMFDNQYAAELMITASRLAFQSGSLPERICVLVGQAVFGCYDRGRQRIESEATLLRLHRLVEKIDSDAASGDLWAGIAFSHALACRWDQVAQPVELAVSHYERVTDSHGFEIAHTRWMLLWSDFFLGRWRKIQASGESLIDNAIRRDDLFQQIVSTSGFGTAAWLARDHVEQAQLLLDRNSAALPDPNRLQMFHFFQWISYIQIDLYQGDYESAWNGYRQFAARLQHGSYRRIQYLRVISTMQGALVALHRMGVEPEGRWDSWLDKLIRKLRNERIAFSDAIADYLEGSALAIHPEVSHNDSVRETARNVLSRARDRAAAISLTPYRLLSEDLLSQVETGQYGTAFEGRMTKNRIVNPDSFRRLYGALDQRP